MQMVINISKKDYEYAKDYIYGRCNVLAIHNTSRILGAIADGTPLPKGHGRLIDADRLKEIVHRNTVFDVYDQFVDMQPTVIEADRSDT